MIFLNSASSAAVKVLDLTLRGNQERLESGIYLKKKTIFNEHPVSDFSEIFKHFADIFRTPPGKCIRRGLKYLMLCHCTRLFHTAAVINPKGQRILPNLRDLSYPINDI